MSKCWTKSVHVCSLLSAHSRESQKSIVYICAAVCLPLSCCCSIHTYIGVLDHTQMHFSIVVSVLRAPIWYSKSFFFVVILSSLFSFFQLFVYADFFCKIFIAIPHNLANFSTCECVCRVRLAEVFNKYENLFSDRTFIWIYRRRRKKKKKRKKRADCVLKHGKWKMCVGFGCAAAKSSSFSIMIFLLNARAHLCVVVFVFGCMAHKLPRMLYSADFFSLLFSRFFLFAIFEIFFGRLPSANAPHCCECLFALFAIGWNWNIFLFSEKPLVLEQKYTHTHTFLFLSIINE